MGKIKTAMILAAGLGRRLQPITDHTPKPLVQVKEKALIDYALDLVRGAGIADVVINCHHLADQIEAHARQISDLTVQISDERGALLETGGGVQKALPLLGNEPFAVINSDVIVRNSTNSSLKALVQAWDAQKMDLILLLQPRENAAGYEGSGDYHIDDEGRLQRRAVDQSAPYIFSGVQIVSPRLFDGLEEGRFSMNVMFDKAAKAGRLFGLVHDGIWLHVGTVEALKEAEEVLSNSD
jgi:MurNAc alpha-1-phosphate uridylyltransferase